MKIKRLKQNYHLITKDEILEENVLRYKITIIMLVATSMFFWNCDPIDPPVDPNDLSENTCQGCHTSRQVLEGIISELQLDDDSSAVHVPGDGSAATSLALVEKILIRLDPDNNIHMFSDIDSIHARIACSGCHGGASPVDAADDASTFRLAHEGLRRDPSADPEQSCGGALCHESIVQKHQTSMHSNLWGQKAQVALRAGYETFEECPSEIKDGFTKDCASCHATCGQCHVSLPNAAKGGFINQNPGMSHKFIKTPDEANVCTACHRSRIGDEWNANQERVPGNFPDLHNNAGMTCLDCHIEDLHGEGGEEATYTSRSQVQSIPKCTEFCHVNDRDDNLYHAQHWPNGDKTDGADLSCFVCHSQEYTNCNTCHAGSWQDEYAANNTGDYRVYPQFKIGMNPHYKEANHPHTDSRFITVRHVPASRDMFSNEPWGIAELSAFDSLETWKYSSSHSLQRWTDRTLVQSNWAESDTIAYTTETCSQSCHFHSGGAYSNPVNKGLYLLLQDFTSDATGEDLSDEITANQSTMLYVPTSGCSSSSSCHADDH
jgi:hypothetical protein